jgi:hypothetical protein
MFSIEQSHKTLNAYDIKISAPGTGWRGYKITVSDLAGIHTALDHYFGQPHKGKETGCPFCCEPSK